MVSASLVAALVVLLPAMGLLWVYLRRYEGYFDQNRLFFALLVGLFVGIVVRFLEVNFFPFDNPRLIQPVGAFTTGTLVYSAAYTTVGFALLETLGKTALVGFKKFRMRKDTPYYGVAAGLGFGAMWVLQFMMSPVHGLRQRDGHLVGGDAAVALDVILFMLALGLLLTHTASGVWVGRGAAEGMLWRGLMHGTLWMAPGLACYWVTLNGAYGGLASLAALAWGVVAVAVADKRVLEPIVPPEIREQVRRERRRTLRSRTRGKDDDQAPPGP